MLDHAMVSFAVKLHTLYLAARTHTNTHTQCINKTVEKHENVLENYLGNAFREKNIWCLSFLFFQSTFLFQNVNSLLKARTIFQVTNNYVCIYCGQ